MIRLNNHNHPWTEGLTVQNLLEQNNYIYPDIIVKIDGKFIPKEDYKDVIIQDGADVLALHMFGGG
ncbi:MAG: sulfur carrier protein ThiS [Promethearchaeota archaeon]